MIRWPFLLVERLIREKAHVCEYVAVLAAEFAHYQECCQHWSIRSEVHYGIRPNDKGNARLGERIRKSSRPGGHFIPQECEG